MFWILLLVTLGALMLAGWMVFKFSCKHITEDGPAVLNDSELKEYQTLKDEETKETE